MEGKMLKRILFVVAILAIMLPVAAQDKAGRWFVDVNYNYDQASGLDTVYAYAYGYNYMAGLLTTQTQTFVTDPGSSWSPEIKVGYETDTWKAWGTYYKFSDTAVSNAGHQNDYFSYVLINTLPVGTDPLFGWDGFVYGDTAVASTEARFTHYDFNFGRKFKPTENWGLLLYTGVKYFKIDNHIRVTYNDYQDWNDWGVGAFDVVDINSRSNGYGINLGLESTMSFRKRFSVTAGAEISMVHTSRKNEQIERIEDPDGPLYYPWQSYNENNQILPVTTLWLEGGMMFNQHWSARMGYKTQIMKDVLSYGTNVNDYPFLSGWAYESKDVAFDGMYFGLTFKF